MSSISRPLHNSSGGATIEAVLFMVPSLNLLVREVVSGVHEQVRLERREAAHPRLLPLLVRRHVHVAEVEHLQRLAARGQQRQLGPAQRERPDLVARGVPEAGGAEQRRSEQVVLSGLADGAQHVKWAITKVG